MVAEKQGGNMIGLDYRIKSEGSLTRKINVEPNRVINDTLRYTMSFDTENFTNNVINTMNVLEKHGYKQVALNNTFKKGRPYMGINTTYLIPTGNMFELQFHTSQSFYIKNEVNHPLYEKQRVLSKGDPQRKGINKQMIQNSKVIPIPLNVGIIKK